MGYSTKLLLVVSCLAALLPELAYSEKIQKTAVLKETAHGRTTHMFKHTTKFQLCSML